MIDHLRKQVAYEKIKVNPTFHHHVKGKNSSNINKLKEDTKTLINIPYDNENDVRIEGAPEGVALVEKLFLERVHKVKNEICMDRIIEQRFQQNIIGAKGEKIRKIRDKFNQANITFPKPGLKSEKLTIRGPKTMMCYKYLHHMNDEMNLTNFTVGVSIYE
ncbi:vigilin [Nephila pilipes]|uniref:Vigilin n=1 Tax=Nephila pilipes TaxID=299642 RepID=A0A8X6Q6C3_NEPPI|nr:vigilin [Nephila pilipes]